MLAGGIVQVHGKWLQFEVESWLQGTIQHEGVGDDTPALSGKRKSLDESHECRGHL